MPGGAVTADFPAISSNFDGDLKICDTHEVGWLVALMLEVLLNFTFCRHPLMFVFGDMETCVCRAVPQPGFFKIAAGMKPWTI